ncbi:hypothetical protein [Aeromicrobium sp. 179-A 4D2 NHS]|uniref:hypothetical protein n=1 Tax=Aeromicrobium sp. 179-A 4D2 NHS TaxID=3142375 RepID=UPI0039A27EAD
MTVMNPAARWSQEKAVEAVIPGWKVRPGDDIRVIASRNDDTYEFEIWVRVRRDLRTDVPFKDRPFSTAERRVDGDEAVEVFNHLIGWDDYINDWQPPHTRQS